VTGARILVVDDEQMTIDILARFLATKGHRVAGAPSAEDGADALRQGRYDLVLLDVVLPGRTGLQALADFLKLTKAPIYVMSGMNDDESRKDAVLLGAAGFFPKPFDFPSVLAAIDALKAP
jgi:DNA-binding response OmpR family regulator